MNSVYDALWLYVGGIEYPFIFSLSVYLYHYKIVLYFPNDVHISQILLPRRHPLKYELGIEQVTHTLMIVKNAENNGKLAW